VVGFLVVVVTAFFISGLHETDGVMDDFSFSDGGQFVMLNMKERLELGGVQA
jgi:hypothetical protein